MKGLTCGRSRMRPPLESFAVTSLFSLNRHIWTQSCNNFDVKGGAKLSFDDIIGGYNRIKDDYDKSAIGAKDIIAAVFFEFHPVSEREVQDYKVDLTTLQST